MLVIPSACRGLCHLFETADLCVALLVGRVRARAFRISAAVPGNVHAREGAICLYEHMSPYRPGSLSSWSCDGTTEHTLGMGMRSRTALLSNNCRVL